MVSPVHVRMNVVVESHWKSAALYIFDSSEVITPNQSAALKAVTSPSEAG